MTVKELIEHLQQLDPDLHVFTRGYEGGYQDVHLSNVREIALNVHDENEWYYGSHESADHHRVESNHKILKYVIKQKIKF